jgi:serine/threonine protein kinase
MFLFEAYLGEGGNGEVHRVREVAPPNRAFACKQIPKAIRTSRNCADRRYRQPRIILLLTLRTKATLFATAGASDYERMTRFDQIKSEIQTLYTVAGHESVIELHDVYEDANHWYLILDLCDGT